MRAWVCTLVEHAGGSVHQLGAVGAQDTPVHPLPRPLPHAGEGSNRDGLHVRTDSSVCQALPGPGVQPPLLPVTVQIGVDGLVQGASGLDTRDQVAFAQQGLASYPAN